MWDVEDPPGEERDPRRYAEHIVANVKPGSIILMHIMYRGNQVARDALPLVIGGLKARGFRIVPVGELEKRAG
jgi:peptidoglycan/xylan/chitin deacetylase (PgdA/CDA1 family)